MRRFGWPLLLGVLLGACSTRAGEFAGRGLDGRLIYSQASEGVWQVDLESGKISQLWEVPEGGLVFGLAVSPDGLDLALAYAPPNPSSNIPRADLYLANADGSSPQPLLEHVGLYESFDYPAWSSDGQWLYFTRTDVSFDEDQTVSDAILNIERIPAGGGQPELVIANAEQPSISADGSRIAYLHFSLETYTRSLWVADIDGSNAVQLLPEHRFFDLASPRFSPNGELIAFAGSGELQPAHLEPHRLADRQPDWRTAGSEPPGLANRLPGEQPAASEPGRLLDRLMGVRPTAVEPPALLDWLLSAQPAYAHGLPWDFWTIPVGGGQPTKLTNWATDGAVLSWAPDGERLAMMHVGGLYVSDSGEPVMLVETPLHGGIDWASHP